MLASSEALPLAAVAPDLDGAYAHCRDIVRRHARTFYLASRFLAPPKRRAIHAVYAFCRTADDIVDQLTPAPERLVALERWESHLLDAYDGVARDPIFVAFADAAARFDIPLQPARDLLRGARMDVTIRRYADFPAVAEYCYLVASTVGLLVAPILGCPDPAALPFAIELGRAMQLTNILRDVGEDALMDRIYLPADEMDRFGYSEDDLFASRVDDRFAALMRFQIARCRRIYREAEPGIAMLDPDSRYTVRLALALYSRILDAVEANRFDVYTRRAHVRTRTKMVLAAGLAFGLPAAPRS